MERKPYSGNGKPFVYAMYASEDKEGASETIHELWEKEFEVCPSERFDRRKIEKSALFLLFLSPVAAQSEAVNRSINYAVQQDHPMLTVYLSQTALSPAQRLLLNSQQGIMRYEAADEKEYFAQLFGSALLSGLSVTPAQKTAAKATTWTLISGILAAAALAIVLALGGGATVPEDSLLSELGYSGRMAQIESIYLYGDQVTSEREEDDFSAMMKSDESQTVTPTIWYGGGNQAKYGTIQDVSDFAQLKNLKELSLAGNLVQDISPLFSLKNLSFLDLTGNPIQDLAGIGTLKKLTALAITGTQVSDLSPLMECVNLKTVYVDEEQYQAFQDGMRGTAYSLVIRGPLEEMRNLSCHIFGGPEEYDRPNDVHYGVFIQARSRTTYDSYDYAVFRDEVPLTIEQEQDVDTNGDGVGEKTHLLIRISNMLPYNPDSVYTLRVSYGAYSVVYRIWHKYDKTGQNPNEGQLIATEGFDAPAAPNPS